MMDEVKNLNERIKDLKARISTDSLFSVVIEASMKREIFHLEGQKSLILDEINTLKKQLRRARRGQRWTAIAGLALAVGVGVLTK